MCLFNGLCMVRVQCVTKGSLDYKFSFEYGSIKTIDYQTVQCCDLFVNSLEWGRILRLKINGVW